MAYSGCTQLGRTDMDRQQALAPKEAFLNAPTIQRAEPEAVETFVPAPQSRLLNGALGAAWLFQIIAILTYVAPTTPSESIPTLIFGFAVGLDLVLFFSMLGVIALAAANSARTAPLSFAVGAGTMIFAALCGLVGHPASTWLGDVAFGAVVAVGSVAVFARRA